MEVNTWHRTEVELDEKEWFRLRIRADGVIEVRRIVATWSSGSPRPVLTLIGVETRPDGSTGIKAAEKMLWTWQPEDGPLVRQIPALVRSVLQAIGMVLPS